MISARGCEIQYYAEEFEIKKISTKEKLTSVLKKFIKDAYSYANSFPAELVFFDNDEFEISPKELNSGEFIECPSKGLIKFFIFFVNKDEYYQIDIKSNAHLEIEIKSAFGYKIASSVMCEGDSVEVTPEGYGSPNEENIGFILIRENKKIIFEFTTYQFGIEIDEWDDDNLSLLKELVDSWSSVIFKDGK